MILSTAATTTIEDVAAASGDGQRWYQLYWPRDRAVAASFLGRAQAAGYSVLVVTVDTRMLAWRPRDLDSGYLPFLQGVGIFRTTSPIRRSRRVWSAESTSTRTRPS